MIGKKKKLTIFIVLMIILTFGKGIKGKNSQVDVTPENTEIIKSKSKNGSNIYLIFKRNSCFFSE